MKLRHLFTLFCILSFSNIHAQKTNVNEKNRTLYKKYQKIDLGNIKLDGELLSPADITVKSVKRRRVKLDFYERADFEDAIEREIFQN